MLRPTFWRGLSNYNKISLITMECGIELRYRTYSSPRRLCITASVWFTWMVTLTASPRYGPLPSVA